MSAVAKELRLMIWIVGPREVAVVGAGVEVILGVEVVLGAEVVASVEVEVGASAAAVTAAVTNEESATVVAESVAPPQPARSSITSEIAVLRTQELCLTCG